MQPESIGSMSEALPTFSELGVRPLMRQALSRREMPNA